MRYSLTGLVLAAFALVLMMTAMTALAVDYYVDCANGDDTNGGSSEGDAWNTITHAIEALDPARRPRQPFISREASTRRAPMGRRFRYS